MLQIRRALALVALVAACSFAQDISPEKQAKIEELIQVTKAQSLLTQTTETVRERAKSMFLQQIHNSGVQLTPAQQAITDEYMDKMQDLTKQELSWDRMKALYLKLYAANFNDSELDGILAFYKTPAGQAVVEKMPVLMSQIMGEMQRTVQEMVPKMQQLSMDMVQKLKAETAAEQKAQPQSRN